MFDNILPSRQTDAAVSSQEDSIPKIVMIKLVLDALYAWSMVQFKIS